MLYTKFEQKLRWLFMGLAIALAAIILVKSLTPALPSLNINNADKFIHVIAYLILGAVTLPALPRVRPVLVVLGVAGFGAGIEVLQGMINTGRSADIYDAFANALGAVLAVIIWVLLTRYLRKPNEMRENKL